MVYHRLPITLFTAVRPENGCFPHEFKCVTGGCIPLTWKCDRHPDCADHSDESSCGKFKCLLGTKKLIYQGI